MPTDCALVVAIPVDRSEVETQWHRGSDFLHRYAAAVGARTVDELWLRYQPYANICDRTMREVATLSVDVTRSATLNDMAEAIRDHSVVTLVAHARDGDVTAGDILDCEKASAVLAGIVADSHQRIGDIRNDAESLAKALNEAIDRDLGLPDDWHLLPSTTRAAWRVQVLSERWSRRGRIETMSEGAIRPGVGIEFADRFCTVEEINRAVPLHLPGTLDLTVCESVLVAEALRRSRPDGVILSNADPTTPDFRLLLYRETVALMRKRKHLSYADAALALRAFLKGRSCPQ